MASTDIKEIKFSFNRDNYETILDCLKDLAKINTMIKIKFDKNIYSSNLLVLVYKAEKWKEKIRDRG